MAEKIWCGGAPERKHKLEFEPDTVTLNDWFGLRCGDYEVRIQATTATAAFVVGELYDALRAANAYADLLAPYPLRQGNEITWSTGATTLVATAQDYGTKLEIEPFATGTSSWLSTVEVQAPGGPSVWSDPANWSGGALPVAGDTIEIGRVRSTIKYGLDALAGVALARTRIGACGVEIGLPWENQNSSKYYREHRPRHLELDCREITIADVTGYQLQPGLVKLKTIGECHTTIYGTGVPVEPGAAPVQIVGANPAGSVTVYRGVVDLGMAPGETGELGLLELKQLDSASESIVNLGRGYLVHDVRQHGGLVGVRRQWRGTWTKTARASQRYVLDCPAGTINDTVQIG